MAKNLLISPNYARVRMCVRVVKTIILVFTSIIVGIFYIIFTIYSNHFLLVILNIKVVNKLLYFEIKYISLQPSSTNTKEIKIMNVSDIPSELMSKIRSSFEAEPKVREMRVQQQMFMRTGKYQDALDVAKYIDTLFNKVVYEYLEENKEQVEQVDIATLDMPIDDKEELMKLLLVCFMCSDIIKSSIQDMDSILHKYDKNMYMELFNDIRQVMDLSEQKLQYLQDNSGYLKDLVWGEKCDNMYEVIKSKAGAIMRKRKEDPNWGKNTEKFNKTK